MQDGYHPTPTSEYAHLVLPAAIWGEKEGTYTNSERRVSKVNRAVAPPGEARSDFDIFLELAGALGVRDELFPGWTKPADAFEEWKRVSAGRLCDYSGMTYEAIEQHGGVQWPFPAGATNPRQTRRLYADGGFRPTTAGRGCCRRRGSRSPSSRTTEFPFVLNTGRTVEHWHTRTKTGEGADSRAAVAERLGRDEPARRARPRVSSRRTAWTSSRGAAACAASSCASPRRWRPARSSCRSTTPRPTRTR